MKLGYFFGVVAFVLCGCSEKIEQTKNYGGKKFPHDSSPAPVERNTNQGIVEDAGGRIERSPTERGNADQKSVLHPSLEAAVFEPIPSVASSIPIRFQRRLTDTGCPSVPLESGFVFSYQREDGALVVQIQCGFVDREMWAAVLPPHTNCFAEDSAEENWVIMKWFSFCAGERPPVDQESVDPQSPAAVSDQSQESVDPASQSAESDQSQESMDPQSPAAAPMNPQSIQSRHEDVVEPVGPSDSGMVPPQNDDDGQKNAEGNSTPEISEKLEDEECTICSDKLNKHLSTPQEIELSECKHRFHTHCILRWLDQNEICPLCRGNADGLIVCNAVEGTRGVGFSYIHPSEGLILAIVCEKTGEVAGPVEPWDHSGICPDRLNYLSLGIEAEIEKRCPPVVFLKDSFFSRNSLSIRVS